MARWTDNGTRLDLGALGQMDVFRARDGWYWAFTDYTCGTPYPTAARARSAAESWLRRALKQAARRLEATDVR